MNAMLVIKTKRGYAVAPYTGPVPNNFVEGMSAVEELKHSYRDNTVAGVMEAYFTPADAKESE